MPSKKIEVFITFIMQVILISSNKLLFMKINQNYDLPRQCLHIVHRLAFDDGSVRSRDSVVHTGGHERVLMHEAHGSQVRGGRVVPISEQGGLVHTSHF